MYMFVYICLHISVRMNGYTHVYISVYIQGVYMYTYVCIQVYTIRYLGTYLYISIAL